MRVETGFQSLVVIVVLAVDSDGDDPDGFQVNVVGVANAELAANVIAPSTVAKVASFARRLTFNCTLIGGTPKKLASSPPWPSSKQHSCRKLDHRLFRDLGRKRLGETEEA